MFAALKKLVLIVAIKHKFNYAYLWFYNYCNSTTVASSIAPTPKINKICELIPFPINMRNENG